MAPDPTQRFSSRVENYRRYRPGYPAAVLDVMRAQCGFTSDTLVADLGCGTGIFAELLLQNGNSVIGIEPNDAMRAAAEEQLAGWPKFRSVCGTAEATTLPDHSVDLITAAQAFHWFDRARTKPEFARALKPNGWLVLVWNERKIDGTPFLREYENLFVTLGTDYLAVRHRDLDLDQVRAFAGHDAVSLTVLESRQDLDFEGLQGRVFSSSYTPEPGQPNYAPMLEGLAAVFAAHEENGTVAIEYETKVYCAQLTAV